MSLFLILTRINFYECIRSKPGVLSQLRSLRQGEVLQHFLNFREKLYSKFGIIIVVVLLLYVHGKHLRSCRDGQLTYIFPGQAAVVAVLLFYVLGKHLRSCRDGQLT